MIALFLRDSVFNATIIVWTAQFQIAIVIVPHVTQPVLCIGYFNLISFNQVMAIVKLGAMTNIIRYLMVLCICANVRKKKYTFHYFFIICLFIFSFKDGELLLPPLFQSFLKYIWGSKTFLVDRAGLFKLKNTKTWLSLLILDNSYPFKIALKTIKEKKKLYL